VVDLFQFIFTADLDGMSH